MTNWGTALGDLALGASIVIAVLGSNQWYRHRARGSGWAALAFALLAALAILGKVAAMDHHNAWITPPLERAVTAAVLVIPFLFFCFAAAFRPPRPWVQVLAGLVTLAVVGFTAVIKTLPPAGAPPTVEGLAYRGVIACQLAFLLTFVVTRLWSAGNGHAAMVAQRMRLLAVGAAGIDILAVISATGWSTHHRVALAIQALTVLVGVVLTLVLPSFVQSWWSARGDRDFQNAVADLMTMESSKDVCSGMLPHICALVGASRAALVDADGTVFAEFKTPVGIGTSRTVPVTSRFGPDKKLVVDVDPSILYFGRDELQRLDELADLGASATERCDAKETLTHQILHDSLTGLPNRDLFVDRLSQALAVVQRHSSMLAVMFIDLDFFKLINDRINHATGDAVLVEVARRLADTVRGGDTVARIGGDEFVAVVEVETEEDALIVADRIREAIAELIDVGDRELSVTASVGLVTTADRSADPFGLLRDADAAMYLAKEAGRDHVQVFSEHIRARNLERTDLESELLRAVEEGQFRLHFQPVIRLRDGVAVGVEALVRWQHPTRGLLSPDSFIPLAEESGLITQLGAWVLATACRQAVEWLEVLPEEDPFTMWVNGSAKQFQRTDVASSLLEMAADMGLDPRVLGIEITETVFMSDKERLRTSMSDLNWNGVAIAIDDFGTGFSSLSYLKRFPVDILKIDKSFVQGIGQEPETSLVAACLNLARSLDILTVAEGVETKEQADWLTRAGCDHVQGYAYCRPVEAAQALEVLMESRQGANRRSKFSAYRELTKTSGELTPTGATGRSGG